MPKHEPLNPNGGGSLDLGPALLYRKWPSVVTSISSIQYTVGSSISVEHTIYQQYLLVIADGLTRKYYSVLMIRSSSGLSDSHCPSDPMPPLLSGLPYIHAPVDHITLGHRRTVLQYTNTCTSAQTPEQPITARGWVCMADRHLSLSVCLPLSVPLPPSASSL